jgi:hypothetical protein
MVVSLTLREENRILKRIFDPKSYENRQCKRLHNDERNSFYHSPNIVRVIKARRIRLAFHAVKIEESRFSFKILIDKSIGKRPLERSRRG